MPTYEYLCDNCHNNFEIMQSIKAEPVKVCDKCGSDTIHRVIFPTTVFCSKEPKTLGQLAEKNTKKMGRYELQEKRRAHKESEVAARNQASIETGLKLGHTPKLIDIDAKPVIDKSEVNKINKMTEKQVKDYINNG